MAITGETLLLGVDLGGTDVKFGIVTSAGTTIDQGKIPTLPERGAEDVLKRIARALDDILVKNNLKRDDVRGIGFGSPGPLSTKRGIVIDTPNLMWKNVHVQAVLEKELGLPVVLHNDANAAAYGEYWKGAGRWADIMIMYTLGTGVGGGICINGDLLVGPGENAGELGHMVLDPKGLKCPCGGYGHLEAYSSAKAVVRDAIDAIDAGEDTELRNVPRDRITSLHVYNAALDGDAVAKRIFHRVGYMLGVASGTLVNVLNANMFVFGGAMAGAWDVIYDPLIEGAKFAAMAMPFEDIKFVRAELGNNAGMIGSAGLAYKAFVHEPHTVEDRKDPCLRP